MASTAITTTTWYNAFSHDRALVRSVLRLWIFYNTGSAYVYRYSDDDGTNWSGPTTIVALADVRGTAFYDSVNGRMNIATSGGNNLNIGLQFHSITSNVSSGTPGSLNTTTIDPGGSNVGVYWPYAFFSPSASNKRYWIIAGKLNSASLKETRAWHVDVDTASAADTGGNWVNTNFTNLGANNDNNNNKLGVGFYWTIGGAERVTLLFTDGSTPEFWEAVTFDPAAATPTPGTVTTPLFTMASGGSINPFSQGHMFTAHAKADYAVFGRHDTTAGTYGLWKSTNGTTWTQPAGWSGLTGIGRAQLTYDGTDFHLLYSPYGDMATTAGTLSRRKITTSSDALSGATTFSDTAGNQVAVPLETGASKIYGFYRASTVSPFSLRSDSATISSDVTPPGQATVEVTAIAATTVDIEATMPSDGDTSQWEVRYQVGSTPPSTNRSDGVVSLSPAAAVADAVKTHTITGLTSGLAIVGRVFVKDTTGNWNTGVTFNVTPGSAPTFLQRYHADGVTTIPDSVTVGGINVILEWQLASANFLTGGANGHLVFSSTGTNTPTPVLLDSELDSNAFQYEDATGEWSPYPVNGLASTDWARKVRVRTAEFVPDLYTGLIRTEQR